MENNLIKEQIVEIQHEVSGRFLDIKGQIADAVKKNGLFSDWQINQNNTINFYNMLDNKQVKNVAAVVTPNLIRFTVYNGKLKRSFEDESLQFFETLEKLNSRTLSTNNRVGIRIKHFIPKPGMDFKEIYKIVSNKFVKTDFFHTISVTEHNLQLVFEIKQGSFRTKIVIGPIQKNEAKNYFGVEAEGFIHPGIYIDIDCFKINTKLSSKDIKADIHTAIQIIEKMFTNIVSFIEM